LAFIAGLGTWLVTALGAATVFFFSGSKQKILNMMLGFAAGVMIAASFGAASAVNRESGSNGQPHWPGGSNLWFCWRSPFFIW
jgi:ZIP family zinc transporter